MTNYQQKLFEQLKEFWDLNPTWPTYPKYHTGDYFEQYFIKRFLLEMPKTNRIFVPIHWTAARKENKIVNLYHKLGRFLDFEEKHFTVSTDDDSPCLDIINNLSFSAGGNKGDIPIPLVVCPIPKQYLNNLPIERKYLSCFVGSNTHSIRQEAIKSLNNSKKHYISISSQWSDKISDNSWNDFLFGMKNSKFALCPRGYGATSYRLYEAMQFGTVPVFISDKRWLPWESEIPWEDFSLFLTKMELPLLNEYLEAHETEWEKMSEMCKKIYKDYFTFDKIYNKIIGQLR